MSWSQYLLGAAFFAGTVGAVGLAALIVVRRRYPHLHGSPAILAFGVLATAGIVGVHLAPGLVGLLSRSAVLVLALAVLALVAWRVVPAAPAAASAANPGPPHERVSWPVATSAVAAAALIAWTAAAAWAGAATPSVDIDTLTFHTPNVVKWMQTGSFWRVDQFSPLLANGNYPQNGDVVFLAVLLPWESDAFARLVGIPFLALAAVAVYAIGLELRAPRSMAAMLALVFASLPAALFAAHEGAKTDAIMLGTFGAGLLFLLRHFRTGRRSELVLAGLGLGLAFGTKWYGVSSVVALVVLWGLAWLLARRPVRALASNFALMAALVAAAGGFWLVRNLVESGNPALPTRVEIGGVTLFDAARDFIRECGGSTIASYASEPMIWTDFVLPAYRENFGLPGLALALAVAATLLLGARAALRGRLEPDLGAGPAALAGVALVLALVYSITPYSAFGARGTPTLVGANTRWLLPALLVAAGAAAAASQRLGRRGAAVAAVLGLVAVADGIRRGFSIPRTDVAVAAATLVGVAIAVSIVRAAAARWRGRWAAAGACAGLALLAILIAGYDRQRQFHEGRYLHGDPVIAYLAGDAAGGGGEKVGLAGIFSVEGLSPVLPAFGPRLRNEVSYVGHLVKGQMREYETADAFVAAVRRGGYDLLVLGKGGYAGCEVPGTGRQEARWARAAGFSRVAESDRMSLFVRGA